MDLVTSHPNFDEYEPDFDKYLKDLQRQPLVDILVALTLINDLFIYLRHEW
ncbi:MAG: hypothetical protein ACFFG0_17525 [Candidatus Thorarchaeota archaeon]